MKSKIMNPHKISANSDHKQKSFIPKKYRRVTIRDYKKSDFLNSNSRIYDND